MVEMLVPHALRSTTSAIATRRASDRMRQRAGTMRPPEKQSPRRLTRSGPPRSLRALMRKLAPFLFVCALVWAAASVATGADKGDASGVATVGDRTITRAELEEHVRPKLIEIDNERYEALREGLDELISEELEKREAKTRGISTEELEKQEVTDKTPTPSDADVQKLYDDNKAQLGGQTLDQVKPRIIEYLKEQQSDTRRQAFIGELKKKYKTTVTLRPPMVEVAAAGRP